MTESSQQPHLFVRPGQVAADRPAPDRCVECGQPSSAHPSAAAGLATPGSTPTRMLLRAITEALTLPPALSFHDEQLRHEVLEQRAGIVAAVCQRLADDREADSMDILLSAASMSARVSDYPPDYTTGPS